MTRLLAYSAYGLGSCVFLGVALSRGSTVLALGSVLFLVGTLMLLLPEVRRRCGAYRTSGLTEALGEGEALRASRRSRVGGSAPRRGTLPGRPCR